MLSCRELSTVFISFHSLLDTLDLMNEYSCVHPGCVQYTGSHIICELFVTYFLNHLTTGLSKPNCKCGNLWIDMVCCIVENVFTVFETATICP